MAPPDIRRLELIAKLWSQMLVSKAPCRHFFVFFVFLICANIGHTAVALSGTEPPPEAKRCDFLPLCAWSHSRSLDRRAEMKRESSPWHLKSTCHCNSRGDSLPSSSRYETLRGRGAFNKRGSVKCWFSPGDDYKPWSSVLFHFFLSPFFVTAASHPSCNTVGLLDTPYTHPVGVLWNAFLEC